MAKTLDVDAAIKTISVRLLDRARARQCQLPMSVTLGCREPVPSGLSADAETVTTLVVERSVMMLTIEWELSSGAELGDYMFVTQATISPGRFRDNLCSQTRNMGFRLPDELERIGVQRYQVGESSSTGSIADIRVRLIDWHDTANGQQPWCKATQMT
ncbi:MAG: hypothetical protein IPJ34_42880 [Myxococcales bacterium]|nr:hypothetical protein [Myxococcales bacterium]